MIFDSSVIQVRVVEKTVVELALSFLEPNEWRGQAVPCAATQDDECAAIRLCAGRINNGCELV